MNPYDLKTTQDAIDYLKANGALLVNRQYSNVQLGVLIDIVIAKSKYGSIAEDKKRKTGEVPSFWTFLEPIKFSTDGVESFGFPPLLSEFCRLTCEGDINEAIAHIDYIVKHSMATNDYCNETYFRTLSDFMRDVRFIVQDGKQQVERRAKSIKKLGAKHALVKIESGGFYTGATAVAAELIKMGRPVLRLPMPDGNQSKKYPDVLNHRFCQLCYKLNNDSSNFCYDHCDSANNRNARNLINRVFKKVILLLGNNYFPQSNRYSFISFESDFNILELGVKKLGPREKSILLFKWLAGIPAVQSFREKLRELLEVEGNLAISGEWENGKGRIPRKVFEIMSSSGYFLGVQSVGLFDSYCREHGVEKAIESYFGFLPLDKPYEFYRVLSRFCAYRMIEILDEVETPKNLKYLNISG